METYTIFFYIGQRQKPVFIGQRVFIEERFVFPKRGPKFVRFTPIAVCKFNGLTRNEI